MLVLGSQPGAATMTQDARPEEDGGRAVLCTGEAAQGLSTCPVLAGDATKGPPWCEGTGPFRVENSASRRRQAQIGKNCAHQISLAVPESVYLQDSCVPGRMGV